MQAFLINAAIYHVMQAQLPPPLLLSTLTLQAVMEFFPSFRTDFEQTVLPSLKLAGRTGFRRSRTGPGTPELAAVPGF